MLYFVFSEESKENKMSETIKCAGCGKSNRYEKKKVRYAVIATGRFSRKIVRARFLLMKRVSLNSSTAGQRCWWISGHPGAVPAAC
jgi:hypothetical protein